MNSSDSPSRFPKAFGMNGLKNTIPTDSSTSTDNNGVATFDKGFPQITMQPLSAGGIPPSGKDFNGILYALSLKDQWADAGMGYTFNSDFSSAISGYPKGSVLTNSTFNGSWLNLNEGNSTNPEVNNASSTGWVPLSNYGYTSISGVSSLGVTLTTLQAAKERIIISGSLTAGINIIFPTWLKKWDIENNCTGAFSVIVRTPSGTGVVVPNGRISQVYGDGTDIKLMPFTNQNSSGIQRFTSSGSFTVPIGINTVYISGSGGGAGGGSGGGSNNGYNAGSGGGGGAGASVIKQPLSVVSGQTYTITIGAGGNAGVGVSAGTNGTNGTSGGTTSFGSLISLNGGTYGSGGTAGISAQDGAGGVGGDYGATDGTDGGGVGGSGGSGPFGTASGGGRAAIGGGKPARDPYGYGVGGGGGGAGYQLNASGGAGSAGRPGVMIVEW
ncbi:hypothetical protein I6H07_14935 [Hafnia alvei]|uniref:glycine-rich domain-containing protein n=1 Tax=Hafnia alvei TaxID=569 RepID=UPI000FD818A2|nr:phage tail protein [Hafnia alvei]MBI0277072.1 hypothetical protein [Hafnia alvei]